MKRLGVAIASGNSVYDKSLSRNTSQANRADRPDLEPAWPASPYVTTCIQFTATIRETRNARISRGSAVDSESHRDSIDKKGRTLSTAT